MPLSLSGKQKSGRVGLDYHSQGGGSKRWHAFLAALASLLLPLLLLAFNQWRWVSAPLAGVHRVHAGWEDNCSVCHDAGVPIASGNAVRTMFGIHSDANCESCHKGPQHHARQVAGDVPSCATCHREHRGREVSLVDIADRLCTTCHADLANHTMKEIEKAQGAEKPTQPFEASVTSFARNHPDFRVRDAAGQRLPLATAKDPGKLHFNHQLHLNLGLKRDEKSTYTWTLDQIRDDVARERYLKQQPEELRQDNAKVQLACASCHQLDTGDLALAPGETSPRPPERSAGAHMLPINYERHCQACHPLTFDKALRDTQIPHGLQPTQVEQFLWGVYGERGLDERKDKKTGRPLPGRFSREEEAKLRTQAGGEVRAAGAFIFQENTDLALRYVFTGLTTCGLCHEYSGLELGKPTKIVPPEVPEVWFPHAIFNHRSHRALACLECHQGAATSSTRNDVLLPDVANCRTCHAPAELGKTGGGVRHSCTSCHRYHHGDHPRQGLGAERRGAQERMTLKEFLAGKLANKK